MDTIAKVQTNNRSTVYMSANLLLTALEADHVKVTMTRDQPGHPDLSFQWRIMWTFSDIVLEFSRGSAVRFVSNYTYIHPNHI